MKVKRKVEKSCLTFIGLNGLETVCEYDLGMFMYGIFIIYEDNMPKYLYELFPDPNDPQKMGDLIPSEEYRSFDDFIKWWGKKIHKNLSADVSYPRFAIPIKGFFTEPELVEIELELLEINVDDVIWHLNNKPRPLTLDKENGSIKFDEVTISKDLTIDKVIEAGGVLFVDNAGWESYWFQYLNESRYGLLVYFFEGRLDHISMGVRVPGWKPFEEDGKQPTLKLLNELGGQHKYDWGKVNIEYDPKNLSYSIIIQYNNP